MKPVLAVLSVYKVICAWEFVALNNRRIPSCVLATPALIDPFARTLALVIAPVTLKLDPVPTPILAIVLPCYFIFITNSVLHLCCYNPIE
jgi:hypothetical protein